MAAKDGGRAVKAWHTNYAAFVNAFLMSFVHSDATAHSVVNPPSFLRFPSLWMQNLVTPYTETERACLAHTRFFLQKGRGYSAEQGTQPQTIGYSLADSPVGLLAWIYEKLVRWSDDYPWDDDEGAFVCVYMHPRSCSDVAVQY